MRLAGRRIVITGAASGIGRATAALFAAEGAALGLIDNRAEALARVAAELPQAWAEVADVSAAQQVAKALAGCCRELGGLDGLVNAAGLDMPRPLDQLEPGDWQRSLDVNLTGPYLVCRAALPALQQAKISTIVNISSGAGLYPLPQRSAYCAAKGGLVMFSKALALELAPGIRVNVICPGAVDTPMLMAPLQAAPDPKAELAAVRARYALGRLAQPEEIASAALFLSGADSSFVTGIALAADGGRTFH